MTSKKKNIKTENRKITRRAVAAQQEKPTIASGKSQKAFSAKRGKNAAASDRTGEKENRCLRKVRRNTVCRTEKTGRGGR